MLLAAAGEGDLWDRAREAGVPTRRLQQLTRELNPLADWRTITEIENLIAEFKPDAIHLNSSKIGILGSIASENYRKQGNSLRVAYRIGGWSFLEPISSWKKWLYQKAEQWTAKYKNVIVTVHPGDEALAQTLGIIPREKVISIPNGLDLEEFQDQLLDRKTAREILGLPMDAFVFGTVSNAYATKGLIPYLSQAESFLSTHARTHIAILGDGPLFEDLKHMQSLSAFPERIHLIGHRKDATTLYRAFDVFVLPSRKEGMPWALLEAMAAGLPCIATDVGACKWMLQHQDETCGIIVPIDDSKRLERALQTLCTDETLRQTFSQAAIQNVRSRFTWERTFQGNRDALIGE